MGRHGGGSRSGGSHRSGGRSGGGSRSGGSSIRTSKTPFKGGYNRSYYDRRGRYHTYYTSNKKFGTSSGWSVGTIFALLFVTVHMMIMLGSMIFSTIEFGTKLDGDKSRIFIEDRIDLLTETEEQEILAIFNQVYEASGMPITLYTDDFTWKKNYYSIEVYSEELYYQIGFDEDAMLILFTAENVDGFDDWKYDMYCGDDTEKCFSDAEFDKVLSNFQKGMAKHDLVAALDYAWESVMDDIGKTEFNWEYCLIIVPFGAFYSIFYVTILGSAKKANAAYKYYKENPDRLDMNPITSIHSVCPHCGASNATGGENCQYCGSLLKVHEENRKYI